jgi:hypothetical protein
MHVLEMIPRVSKLRLYMDFFNPKLDKDENDKTFDFAYGTGISDTLFMCGFNAV